MRTCRHLFIFVLLLFACGCNKGPFDPTMYKDGFRGITYTNEYNEIIGPVDHDDWKFYGCYYPIAGGQMDPKQSDSVLSTKYFKILPARPNPTDSFIMLSFYAPIPYAKCTFRIFNENLEEIGNITEWTNYKGIETFRWDLRKTGIYYKGKDKLIKRRGMYRIVYSLEGRIGYGDIWVK